MGNTYSPPLFSLLSQLPCLWLPTATHQKKAAPGEQVAIVTTFTRATPQRVHLSYMLKPLRFHPNLRVCVLAHMSDSWQAAWEGAWGTASNPASFIRQIGWQKVYVLNLDSLLDELDHKGAFLPQPVHKLISPLKNHAQEAVRGTTAKMRKRHCTNIYLFKLNKFLSPSSGPYGLLLLSISAAAESKIKSHIPDHRGPSFNPCNLLFGFHAAEVQRVSWRLRCAYCVLVDPLLSHRAEGLLIASCSPVVYIHPARLRVVNWSCTTHSRLSFAVLREQRGAKLSLTVLFFPFFFL